MRPASPMRGLLAATAALLASTVDAHAPQSRPRPTDPHRPSARYRGGRLARRFRRLRHSLKSRLRDAARSAGAGYVRNRDAWHRSYTHHVRAELCREHGVPNTGRQWARLRKRLAREERAGATR